MQPVEFLKMAWSKPTTAHLSPNLLAAIALFNHVSQWVGTMIVTEEKVRTRAKIMDRCIKIAQVSHYHCRSSKDLSHILTDILFSICAR